MFNQIKEKLNNNQKKKNNNALISKSDKGNSVVIICQNTYHEKATNFIHSYKHNRRSYKKVPESSQEEYQWMSSHKTKKKHYLN